MNNLALMYVQLQLYDRAQQQLINVINILKVQDNIYSELYVIALENLAYINIKVKNYQFSIKLLQESVKTRCLFNFKSNFKLNLIHYILSLLHLQ